MGYKHYCSEDIHDLISQLKKYRRIKKLNKQQMAVKCGVSRPFYTRAENETKGTSLARIIALLRTLGFEIEIQVKPPRTHRKSNKLTIQDLCNIK